MRWKSGDGFGGLFTLLIGKWCSGVEVFLILHRHMNIGNPSRSLALAETGRKEYLPVDDNAWEQGASTENKHTVHIS